MSRDERVIGWRVTGLASLVLVQVFCSPTWGDVPVLMERLDGGEMGEEFGWCVANVEDVNGDGGPDLLVGAGRSWEGWGRGYLYFGGTAFDTLPDVMFVGEQVFEAYAKSLAGAGDVNGDGFSDIVIGACTNGEAAPNAGKAYIYFGGEVTDSVPDVELHGQDWMDMFGWAVAGCGDVNVDGYDDIVIGAWWGGPLYTGEAYVFFGGSPMDTLADLVLQGTPAEEFGASVAGGADVNGDGHPEILVGDDLYAGARGRVYIYYGGPMLDNVADIILEGEAASSSFGLGCSVADMNMDGYADVAVGAAAYDSPSMPKNGRTYLFAGGDPMDATPDVILTGQVLSDDLGFPLDIHGDLDGDGYRDLLVSALLHEKVPVFYGRPWMDRVEEMTLRDPGPESNKFGFSLAWCGDLTGEGFSQFVVGDHRADLGPAQTAGAVYLYRVVPGPVSVRLFPHGRRYAPGERLSYTAGAANNTDEVQDFEVWAEVLMPDGFPYEDNPIWGPVERELAPHDTLVVDLGWRLPLGTPAGQYTWTLKLGPAYPDSVWDNDSFEFKVVDDSNED